MYWWWCINFCRVKYSHPAAAARPSVKYYYYYYHHYYQLYYCYYYYYYHYYYYYYYYHYYITTIITTTIITATRYIIHIHIYTRIHYTYSYLYSHTLHIFILILSARNPPRKKHIKNIEINMLTKKHTNIGHSKWYTPGLHHKILHHKIFARVWVAQEPICFIGSG